jgi:hypothetical protein
MMDWTDRDCRVFHRLMTRHALLYTDRGRPSFSPVIRAR